MAVWSIEDEYFHHETGHHVVVFRNSTNKAKHLLQMLTKAECPHCGHVKLLDHEGNVDIKAEKALMLKTLNDIHEQELTHAKKHVIRTQ